ncbi:MAG: hypothetical protein JXQ72_01940 [Anaerolineae bacterium]|nr:hypothetical protein [Anaerolineae bacterium]
MPTIPADQIEITIRDGVWELHPVGSSPPTVPIFQVMRGSSVMEYTPAFGEAHGLPGTILSLEFVQAVVIGYEPQSRRWRLGLQLARSPQHKPRGLELVRWPPGDNLIYGASARDAGSELAEYIGCPFKIFGAKKPPRIVPGEGHRSGVTGPLGPHKRDTATVQQVKLLTQGTKLPLEHEHLWLGRARDNLELRLDKNVQARASRRPAPSFNRCTIDPKQGTIRLHPPTGLLSFLSGPRAQVVKTGDVQNVELRAVTTKHTEERPDSNKLITEVTYITYFWEIYLTLPDESVLLAQTMHTTSSDLLRQRATRATRFAVDSQAGIEYLRQHQDDQQAKDRASSWAEAAAVVIASTLGVHLVKTEEDEGAFQQP